MTPRFAVLDTNLLVLLIVGSVRLSLIGEHKRVRTFETEDFQLLIDLIGSFEGTISTPNVLTETSNLLGRGDDPLSLELTSALRLFIESVEESYQASAKVANRDEFQWLGLTDVGLIELSLDGNVLLTADAPLHVAVLSAGGNALNFNHLRSQRLIS